MQYTTKGMPQFFQVFLKSKFLQGENNANVGRGLYLNVDKKN